MNKIVLTGANGRLATYLRKPLSKMADCLVSTDIVEDIGDLLDGEIYKRADLANFDQMMDVIEGADMVVHFGAIVDEGSFDKLLGPNFIGSYNVWEAAYRTGARRVIYASSIHAVGMYPRTQLLNATMAHRPDTFYGLAKCFSEDLGRMYFDKNNLESVHLRIYSCAKVNNVRSLSTWLSYDDLIQLVTRAVQAQVTGFSIVYGVSNNDRVNVDNSDASFLGYRPNDNAEIYADEMLAKEDYGDLTDLAATCHGGPFATTDLGVGIIDSMNIERD